MKKLKEMKGNMKIHRIWIVLTMRVDHVRKSEHKYLPQMTKLKSPSINLPTVPISNVSPKVGPSKGYSSFTLTTEPITIPPKEYEVIAENQLVTAVCMSNIFIIMNAMNIWFMT